MDLGVDIKVVTVVVREFLSVLDSVVVNDGEALTVTSHPPQVRAHSTTKSSHRSAANNF